MRQLFGVLLILAVIWLAKDLFFSFKKFEKQQQTERGASESGTGNRRQSGQSSPELAGLPPGLEASLATAKQQGDKALGDWLQKYRVYVRDPRLADIELDYAMLISQRDPAEARRVFKQVKTRLSPDSPVYSRMKKLESAYE